MALLLKETIERMRMNDALLSELPDALFPGPVLHYVLTEEVLNLWKELAALLKGDTNSYMTTIDTKGRAVEPEILDILMPALVGNQTVTILRLSIDSIDACFSVDWFSNWDNVATLTAIIRQGVIMDLNLSGNYFTFGGYNYTTFTTALCQNKHLKKLNLNNTNFSREFVFGMERCLRHYRNTTLTFFSARERNYNAFSNIDDIFERNLEIQRISADLWTIATGLIPEHVLYMITDILPFCN